MSSVRVETVIKYTDLSGTPVSLPYICSTIPALLAGDKRDYTLATATKRMIWDPNTEATENPPNFDFLAIVADGSGVDVEFQTDADNSTTFKATSTIRLFAGLPLMLGADDSYVGGTTSDKFATGTLDLIQRIALQNNSGATRHITVFLLSATAAG